jgi:asparagine synthase (glutamine-hydrolysing)
MAVHAGLIMRDGGPVPERLERILRERLHVYDPDHVHELRAPGCLVLHGARSWAGPEESWREAPSCGTNSITFFDGRLDNRDDLARRYFTADERRRPVSDSAMLGRALSTGESRSLAGCIGDWSAVVLRSADRTVILSSDAMGSRPLYYAVRPFAILWSTDLGAITAAAGLGPSEIDPAYLAGFIAAVPPPLSTPFKGVRAVRPGATLTIDASGREREDLWWAPWLVEARNDRLEDSALELLALWTQVVRDRVPSRVPALFELSGGFDSSSIVCTAADLGTSGNSQLSLHTVTRVVPDQPAWNDIKFVQAVLDRCDCEPHFLDLSTLPAGRDLSAPVPDGPHGIDLATEVLMRTIGARTLVSGRKGDLVMQASPLETAVLTSSLRARRLRDIVRDATAIARATKLNAWRVLRDACQPFRPGFTGQGKTLVPRHSRNLAAVRENLVRHELLRQANDQWADIYRACRSSAPARRGLVCELTRLTHRRRLEPPPTHAHLYHAHPFLDRRLVTFILEREPRTISGAGQSRGLMKKAFRHVLPEPILARRSKGHFGPVMRRKFMPIAESLTRSDRWALAELGVIQGDVVREGLRRFVQDSTMNPGALTMLASAEFWLRRVMFDEPATDHGIDRESAPEFTRAALDCRIDLLQEEQTPA